MAASTISPSWAMAPLPESMPVDGVYIQAVVPVDSGCVVGFTVADPADEYEIAIQRDGEQERVVAVVGLRGAVRLDGLASGPYAFRIRRVTGDVKHGWSASYPINLTREYDHAFFQ